MNSFNNFENINSFSIHKSNSSEVTLEFAQIRKTPYVGLHRRSLPDHNSNYKPESKGVYIPLEAWEKLVVQTIPSLTEAIKNYKQQQQQQQQATQTSTKNSQSQSKSTKHSANEKGIFLFLIISILFFFNFDFFFLNNL